MESFAYYLKFIGYIIGIYIIVYIIYRLVRRNKSAIFSSHVQSSNANIEADLYYFLPAYGLKLDVSATLQITTYMGNIEPPAVKILTLQIAGNASTLPDTTQLIALKYHSDFFSTDELKMCLSQEALLENVAIVVDDQFDEVILSLSEAPKKAIETFADAGREESGQLKPFAKVDHIQTIIVNKTFELFPEDLMVQEIKLSWTILRENYKPFDASFTLFNPHFISKPNIEDLSYYGLLTRPLTRVSWEVKAPDFNAEVNLSFIVPDISRIIKVPISRSLFVKKQHIPKFSKGLLVENYINKPSEAEGAASIPINIGKAIVSIPAHLLKFGTQKNKLQKEYELSIKDLLTAREANSTKIVDQLSSRAHSLEQKVDALLTSINSKLAPIPSSEAEKPPLGKLPPSEPEPTKLLSEILASFIAQSDIISLDKDMPKVTIPQELYWDESYHGTWPDYGNTNGGSNNCVLAAIGHLVICWTSNTKPIIFIENDALIKLFSNRCFESGCRIYDTLSYWLTVGINDNKILKFARIKSKKPDEIKSAIVLFGAILTGFQLPPSAQAKGVNWKIKASEKPEIVHTKNDNGHAVAAVGYDDEGLWVISWGQKIRVDWDFYKEYNDETYVVLSNNWLLNSGVSPTPSNRTLADLKSIVKSLNS